MNAERRKKLEKLNEEVRDILGRVEELKDEEQEYYDNMPESFQGGEKGENAEAAISSMEEAISGLETATDELSNIE